MATWASHSAHTPFSYIFNYTRNPAIVIPCGTAHATSTDLWKVPIGLQIVASKRRTMHELLQLAQIFERQCAFDLQPRYAGLSTEHTPNVIPVPVSAIVCSPARTVLEFKYRVGSKLGIDTGDQRIVFGDKVLDDGAMLSDYGIDLSSVVHVVTGLAADGLAF